MTQADKLEHLLEVQQDSITCSDALEVGVNPRLLSVRVEAGKLERIQRGVYRSPGAPRGTLATWLEVPLCIP